MLDPIIAESFIRVTKKCFSKGVEDLAVMAKFVDWLQKNDLQDDWIGVPQEIKNQATPVTKKTGQADRPKMRVFVESDGDVRVEGDLEYVSKDDPILSMVKPKEQPKISKEDAEFLDPLAGPDDEELEKEAEAPKVTEDELFRNAVPVQWKDETGKIWSGDALFVAEDTANDLFCFCEDGLGKIIPKADILEQFIPAIEKRFFSNLKG